MSGSGYDAVVDVDDEVRCAPGKLYIPTNTINLSILVKSNASLWLTFLRATSVIPISKKISNSTAPTSMSPPPHEAAARRQHRGSHHPRHPPPPPQSAISGACHSTRSSSTSIHPPFYRAAGRPCSRGQTSSTYWRGTPTYTGRFGSQRQSS